MEEGSRPFLPLSRSLNTVAASPRARPSLDQDTDPEEPLSAAVSSGRSVPLDQDTGSEKPPPSSVPSGWLVLGVASQLGNRRSSQCAGPVESSRSSALLNHQHLKFVNSILDFLVGLHLWECHQKIRQVVSFTHPL